MANPALKNGYLSIANELVEKLAKINIPGEEMRLIWILWRKTWGWKNGNRKKDWDKISLSQFAKETGMLRNNVAVSLKSLVSKKILLKSENGYRFNQDYDLWVVSRKIPVVSQRIRPGISQDTKSGISGDTYKRKKETNTKEIVANATSWSFEEELRKLKENPRKDMKIIALYWKKKRLGIS